jgi:hypothetical protein
VAQYGAANLEAAAIVLEDRERHGGESAAMVKWARLIVERSEAPPKDWETGPLFAERTAA